MRQLLAMVMVVGSMGLSSAVFAEPPSGESGELERLRQLKQENPEAFRQAVQERKTALRERLAHLKDTNPEAFHRIQHRLQERRQERRTIRKAKMEERLQALKARNPERYQALMQRRDEWRQRRLEQSKTDQRGVRDHGQGIGRGMGQGGEHRNQNAQGAIRGGGDRRGKQ